jgi:hypothetical protein
VVRGGRIPCGRADAAIFFAEQFVLRELLLFAESPGKAGFAMEKFCECFGKAIGQRLGQDRVIVVMVRSELRRELVGADPCGDSKAPQVVD